MRGIRLLASMALGLLLGCSTTATLERADAFADGGVQYADAMTTLVDHVRDTTIDADSDALLLQQALVADAADRGERLTGYLQNRDDALAALLDELARLQAQVRLMRSYFVALQALAQFDAKGGTAQAVATLSGRIDGLNGALGREPALQLSAEQRGAVAALAGLAARAALAAKVRAALRRDAPVIGEFLLLQQRQLAALGDMVRSRFEAQMRAAYRADVRAPYVSGRIADAAGWKQARRRALTSAFVSGQLAAAESACTNMQTVWTSIVAGERDAQALRSMLADVDAFLGAVEGLRSDDEETAQ